MFPAGLGFRRGLIPHPDPEDARVAAYARTFAGIVSRLKMPNYCRVIERRVVRNLVKLKPLGLRSVVRTVVVEDRNFKRVIWFLTFATEMGTLKQ